MSETNFYEEFYREVMIYVISKGDEKLWETILPVLAFHKKNVRDVIPYFAQILNSREEE